jgi:hypothetical protein
MQGLRRPSSPQATGCPSSLPQGHSTAAPTPLINLVKSQNLQSLTKYKEKNISIYNIKQIYYEKIFFTMNRLILIWYHKYLYIFYNIGQT